MRKGQGPNTLPKEVRARLGASPTGPLRGWLAAAQHFWGWPRFPWDFLFIYFLFLSPSLSSKLEGKLQLGRERFLPCPALGSRGSRRGQRAPALLLRWAFLAARDAAS